MQACSIGTETEVYPEGQGNSVSVIVSQSPRDAGGWIVELYATFPDLDSSRVFIGRTTLGTPDNTARRPTRLVAMASVPAATRYVVIVVGPPGPAPNRAPLQVGAFCGTTTPFAFSAFNP
jgi:hypothetical protein